MRIFTQRFWHDLFELGVLFKAINSAWETLGGLFLLTRLHNSLTHVVAWLNGMPLFADDRHGVFARAAHAQLAQLSVTDTRLFVGAYLLFHGTLNAFLAYHLFRGRLWAYPAVVVCTLLFFGYQTYRLLHTHSVVLLAVSIFDLGFIFLTWHEYRYQLSRRHAAAA